MIRPAIAAAAIAATDLATKLLLVTGPSVQHPVPDHDWIASLALAGAVAATAATVPPCRWLLLVAAGVACNAIDATDGLVENPFQVNVPVGDYAVPYGFNVADLAIYLGLAVVFATATADLVRRARSHR